MRFLIICPSAKAGSDGVGDYSRHLAKALTLKGHEAALLAINDKLLESDTVVSPTEARISSRLSIDKRIKFTRKFVKSFQPDVLSLQYVNYGFHPKGLPFGLEKELHSLTNNVRWHIMFHELWIEPHGSIVNLAISLLQRSLVFSLCQDLGPAVIHTSNFYYQKRLERIGVRSTILPIFSSIAVFPHQRIPTGNAWTFVFFGSLRKGWDPNPLLQQVEKARILANKKLCYFISVGRIGPDGDQIYKGMMNAGFERFKFARLGELPSREISHQLQAADFGIAISPLHLLAKSSAVAAMWEHGLPVIVSSAIPSNAVDNLVSETVKFHAGKTIVLDDNFVANLVASRRGYCINTTSLVVDQFLNSLGASD